MHSKQVSEGLYSELSTPLDGVQSIGTVHVAAWAVFIIICHP